MNYILTMRAHAKVEMCPVKMSSSQTMGSLLCWNVLIDGVCEFNYERTTIIYVNVTRRNTRGNRGGNSIH